MQAPLSNLDPHDPDLIEFLIQNAKELICLHDLDGTYRFVSKSIKTIAGYEPEELVGRNPYDFFHPKDQDYIRNHSHLPSVDGYDDNFSEYRFKRKEGTYLWLQTQTKRTNYKGQECLITVSRTINDIVSIRSTANKYKNLLEQASHMASVGAWEVDLDEMQPFWSSVVYDIHEVPQGEQPSLEEAIKFYDEGESRETIIREFNQAVETGKPFDVTLRFTGAKGTKKWVRSICSPEVEDGKVQHMYGVFQDVTLQKEKTEQLRLLSDVLKKQKDQLESFNQIVSHNLRSPVSNLPILLDFIEESDSEEDRQELMTNMRSIADSMRQMLDDLVDVAKLSHIDSIKTRTLSLAKMTRQVRAQLEGTIKKNKVDIRLNNEAWDKIIYPETYLESILLNLISNAIKYRSEKRSPVIEIEAQLRHGTKYLVVRDNGSGIDLSRHGNKIFKLHKTFHRHKPGKGLGLFMTKNQITALGGDINVESAVDQGTVFTINFNIPLN